MNTDLNNFNGGVGIFMLFLDFWLWLALYYYLDNVATWHDVGVGRSLCFCLTGSYWREIMGKAPDYVFNGYMLINDSFNYCLKKCSQTPVL